VSLRQALGWSAFFQQQVGDDVRVARVVQQQRDLYAVAGDFNGWAEISGRLRHQAASPTDYPAVGDWVEMAPTGSTTRGVIARALERRSLLSRKAVGRSTVEQAIAANVDTVFLVNAAGQELNINRIERYLTMVWEGGATPVVVLSKCDLTPDTSTLVGSIRERLSFVEVVAVSALTTEGLDQLAPFLVPACTVALLGSSGAGKSTLINRLLGEDRLAVGEVRGSDAKGRHTTTSRQLVEIPGGALLIDTPGMRELQPWLDEPAVDRAFEDIAELSGGCRFSDCAHDGEPDCAVLAAVASGSLASERLEHYRRLLREAAFEVRKRDVHAAREHKQRWKKVHEAQKQHYKSRGKP
jgi:ribosome biogenesis GTPase